MSFSPFLSVLPTMLLFYVRGVSAERRTLQTCRLDLTAPTSGSAAADATVETVRRAVTSAAVSSLFRSPRGDNEIAFREHKCANIELRGSVRSCNKNNEMDPPCLPPRKRLYESASRLVSLGSRRLARQWRGLLNGRALIGGYQGPLGRGGGTTVSPVARRCAAIPGATRSGKEKQYLERRFGVCGFAPLCA